MKNQLLIITLLFLIFNLRAQGDSIFPNLTSYRADVCTHAWDWDGLNLVENLTVYSDDPMTDTLRIMNHDGINFASLWLDGRKTWLRIDSSQVSLMGYEFYHYNQAPEDYPLNEFFLLYDFEVLDTASIGDIIAFEQSPIEAPFYVWGIDTIQINGVAKTRYKIESVNYLYESYLIEGVGGLHPFTPLLAVGFFGLCTCEYEITFASETDTLVLSDTMVFGGDTFFEFCEITNIPMYEKENRFNIYPNPVTGNKFNILTDDNTRIKQINLYDSQGKKYEIDYTVSNTQNFCTVQTSTLSSGLYIVEIVSDSGYYRKKLILN